MCIDLERKDHVYINTIVKFYHTNIHQFNAMRPK